MPTDLQEYTEFFKDRVDELCVLEKQAEERAAELSTTAKDFLLSSEQRVKSVLGKMEMVSNSVDRIHKAADRVDGHISFCTRHVKLALSLFWGSLILSACIWGGTYFWYKHVNSELKEANLELAQADVKLANKPIFLASGNSVSGSKNDYVRVVPNSEEQMSHANGEPYPGVYAQVWHK